MHAPRASDVPSRTASPSSPGPYPLPLPPTVLTAQQAEESIEFIHRELSRLLQACEYRERHPYDAWKGREDGSHGVATPRSDGSRNGASFRTTPTLASHRRDPTASWLSDADPSLKLAQSTATFSFSLDPHRHDTAEAAFLSVSGTGTDSSTASTVEHLSGASFSSFERRRIAHLLGRAALEMAAVWSYIRQSEPLGGASPADPTTPVLPLWTTRGPVLQSNDCSTAALAASPSIAALTTNRGDGCVEKAVNFTNEEPSTTASAVMRSSVLGGRIKEREGACHGHPEAQMTVLSALIETATAIQRSLAMKGDVCGGERAAPADRAGAAAACSVDVRTLPVAAQPASLTCSSLHFDRARAPIEEASGIVTSKQSCRGFSPADASSSVTEASKALSSALSGDRTAELEVTEQRSVESESKQLSTHDAPIARRASGGSSGVKLGSTASSSIPSYLRAYVFEDGADDCADEVDHLREGNGADDNEGTRAELVSPDKSVSHFISAGSANTRSLSRVSDLLVTSHDDHQARPSSPRTAVEHPARASHFSSSVAVTRPSLLGSGGASLTAPTNAGGNGGTATLMPALLDTDPVSHSSSLHIQRDPSALSVQSASLVSLPLQVPQFSAQQSQACSGGSVSSHPNASVSQRSPDSMEMSSAAAAAYLRSTSLFRRPHRLAVPVSRTQSLRRATSISSPVSVEGISLVSATGVVQYNGTLAPASGAHGNSSAGSSHIAQSNSGLQLSSGGVGIFQTSSCFNSFLPEAMGASTTADSPHSSAAGLQFKRVISLDSEGGLWPQGSLADSFEMSQQKVTPLPGQPSASTMEATFSSSPLLQDAGLATATRGHRDHYGAMKSPSEGQSGGVMSVATSFSGHRSSALPPGRSELSRSRNVPNRRGTPKHAVSSSATVTAAPFVLDNSSTWQRPAALLSPAHFRSSRQRRTNGSVEAPTVFSPAPKSAGGDLAADGLTPCLYRVEDEILTEFLRCVHDLTRIHLTDAEFDSLKLYYVLPGVSLVTSASTSRPAPPLPLFEGGERVPLHRGSLDVFCSLIRQRLVAVCSNLRISTAPYLSLL